MTRLLLIRHAEPSADARGRCYGSLDVDLSERGRTQAAALGAALAGDPPDAVYSSPRRRALQTAKVLAADPIVLDDLRELDFGDFEGRTYEEIERSHPEVFARWMTAPIEVEFPGGESYASLRPRALGAAEAIRWQHPGGTAAVVTHGGVVRAILAECLAMPAAAIFRLDVGYTSVSVVEWLGDTPIVRLVNGPGALGPAAGL